MANFNKVFLMGNLTRDPQLSYTPNQTAVVDFGLAVNRRWTGRDGEQREETCFVDCRAFAGTAETINKYLSKGRLVFIEGRLTFNSWTAQDGTRRSKHRVTVENFQFLPGTRAADAGQAEPPDTGGTGTQGESVDTSRPGAGRDVQQRPDDTGGLADDIPF